MSGKTQTPELSAEQARAIRQAAARVARAEAALRKAQDELTAELRAGREAGASLRSLGAEAGLVVSRVHSLVTDWPSVRRAAVAREAAT